GTVGALEHIDTSHKIGTGASPRLFPPGTSDTGAGSDPTSQIIDSALLTILVTFAQEDVTASVDEVSLAALARRGEDIALPWPTAPLPPTELVAEIVMMARKPFASRDPQEILRQAISNLERQRQEAASESIADVHLLPPDPAGLQPLLLRPDVIAGIVEAA